MGLLVESGSAIRAGSFVSFGKETFQEQYILLRTSNTPAASPGPAAHPRSSDTCQAGSRAKPRNLPSRNPTCDPPKMTLSSIPVHGGLVPERPQPTKRGERSFRRRAGGGVGLELLGKLALRGLDGAGNGVNLRYLEGTIYGRILRGVRGHIEGPTSALDYLMARIRDEVAPCKSLMLFG